MSAISLIVYTALAFVNWGYRGTYWVSTFAITLYLGVSNVTLAIAPFNKRSEDYFTVATHPFLRPVLMIVLGCFYFPYFRSDFWGQWFEAAISVVALVTIGLGVIELIAGCTLNCDTARHRRSIM